MTDTILNALMLAGPVLLLIGLAVWGATSLLHVCPPNRLMIFSGRDHLTEHGDRVGYRVMSGGWAMRVPVLEQVEHMDLRLISVPMRVQGAYSQGGIPLTVHAVANVKVNAHPEVVGNALERFLGQTREDIQRVAKETLEGHLRGVVASMTPEEVNEDRLMFAANLEEEALADLQKLGLQLDTLKIQAVSDDRSYLDSIGRERIAGVLRAAKVAESDAVRAAEEAEAEAESQSKVAVAQAQTRIAEANNEMRRVVADLKAEVRSEEERTEAAAAAATAEAEKELQEVRGEVERLRLAAEVTIPARVEQKAAEIVAVGDAAHIAATGKATAQSLAMVAQAWKEADGAALDIHVMQHLEDILKPVTEAVQRVSVKKTALVDGGEGTVLPGYVGSYPAMVGTLLDEVGRTLGLDVGRVVRGERRN